MKLLYKPFSMISRRIAARIAQGTFRSLWARIDEREPPEPTAAEASLSKVVAASALEAATLAAFAALADRAAARAFHRVFGVWPGEKPAD